MIDWLKHVRRWFDSCLAAGLAACMALGGGTLRADEFELGVRTTPHRPAQEEQKMFRLPPGFEAQLFASEPDILKPMNMAFDARGRLWVTVTQEYPYAAPPGRKGRDALKVLEDTDGDGKADKITTFADGLNIPIGIYPTVDGAIVFTIPNITRYYDDDGDGKADRSKVLYGTIGQRDTHGMTNSFRRGFDGWLYALHGFSNDSTLTGSDGSSIKLNSGNSYRMRIDGRTVQQQTWGQVNPFGMGMDELGNWYSADCHSQPIYELLRGGYYPSFGKPDDGLGYVPEMIHHSHGSTAIAGLVFYQAKHFPAEYFGNIFVGNVMTSRVHRDPLRAFGSTRKAQQADDLIKCDDPWFRPVDLIQGPDGALWVADFYNRIIGHYEVPLPHPGRDRTSGRIWRIVYRGPKGDAPLPRMPNLAAMDAPRLIEALGDSNLTVRMLAMDQLSDRIGPAAVAPLLSEETYKAAGPIQKAHMLWSLFRLGAITEEMLTGASADGDALLRVHVQKMLSEIPQWTPNHLRIAQAGLIDGDPFVLRAAADAAGRHPDRSLVKLLLMVLQKTPAEDNHLRHVVRMALRDHVKDASVVRELATLPLEPAERAALAEVAIAAPTPAAAAYVVSHLKQQNSGGPKMAQYLRFAARYADEASLEELATVARARIDGPADQRLDQEISLLRSIQEGIAQRGGRPGPAMRAWALEAAGNLLKPENAQPAAWVAETLPGLPPSASPWVAQRRESQDGVKDGLYFGSLPRGEKLTGVLRSAPFTVPAKLSFFMAGHNGYPANPSHQKSMVRLKVDGAVVATVYPPRHDTARPFTMDLKQHAGKQGVLELIDGDTGDAYAWLAVGRFDPPVVRVLETVAMGPGQRQSAAFELARQWKLNEMTAEAQKTLLDADAEPAARIAAAGALSELEPAKAGPLLASIIMDAGQPQSLRAAAGERLGASGDEASRQILIKALNSAVGPFQQTLAMSLASTRPGAEALLKTIEEGKASAYLLQQAQLADRLKSAGVANLQARIGKLTAGLPPADQQINRLIAARLASFEASGAQPAAGAAVFATYCAACHRVGNQGGLIGPQLDGVGLRGAGRLIEDVLDPNRNVDAAFRYSTITKKDGSATAGLFRRKEGQLMVFADAAGKEFSIPESEITQRVESQLSLMPPALGQAIPEKDFNALIAWLLSQKAAK